MTTTTPTRTRRAAATTTSREFTPTTTTVDNVPVLWVKAPGLKRLVLSFRVGYADEALSDRGLSHICEHLALRQFRDETFAFNGFVDATRTAFLAQGTDKQLVHFARGVTEALSDLPPRDFGNERRVLRAESATRQLNDVDSLLRIRYGARGPGAGSYPEYALYEDNFPAVTAWSQRFFTAANAVAWCSGPPPRGLRFALDAGRGRVAAPEIAALDEERPLYLRRNGGVALGFPLPSEPADFLAAFVLESRLRNRLRHETNTTYSVAANMIRLGLDYAHSSIHADVAPKEGQRAVDELVRVLDELATDGHHASELEAFFALREQAALHDTADLGSLELAAQRVLFGGKPTPDKTWRTKIRRAKPADVAAAVARFRADAVFLIPSDARPPAGTTAVRPDSTDVVTGRSFTPAPRRKGELAVGTAGVTYKEEKHTYTVRTDDAQIMLTWADQSRTVIGGDAVNVGFDPNQWAAPREAVAAIDQTFAHVQRVRVGRRRMLPTGARPKMFRERMLDAFNAAARQNAQGKLTKAELLRLNLRICGAALVAFMGAMFCLAATDSELDISEKAIAVGVGVVLLYGAYIAFRKGARFAQKRVYGDTWTLDSAKAHLDKNRVPDDLPITAAYMVGGLLFGWLASRSLINEWVQSESADELAQFAAGELSGPMLYRAWDGVLASDMLTPMGAKFCAWYYSDHQKRFTADIKAVRGELPSNYHIADTPESQHDFDRRADAHFAEWSKRRRNRAAA